MPDYLAYHQSLSAELTAMKDRVRSLVKHYATDGSFKEGMLRNVLRRHLPETLFVGTGFIVTNKAASKQIDILVLDKSCPRLFCDNDLVIVTPDVVRAAIEVKTGLNSPAKIKDTIMEAARDRAIWYRTPFGCNNISALFVYEARGDHENAILKEMRKAQQEFGVGLDSVVYGEDVFVDKTVQCGNWAYQGWVSQKTDGMALACFIGKLIRNYSEQSEYSNPSAWTPCIPKENVLKFLPKNGDDTIKEISIESYLKQPMNRMACGG